MTYNILFSVIAILLVLILFWLIRRGWQAVSAARQIDWGAGWLNFLDGFTRLFCKYYHRLQIISPLELPPEGPAVVVANHLSGLDPILLMASSPRPLRFLIAREEYQRFGLTWFFRAIGCIPVDRSHRPEVALRAALKALKAGEVIALFPQGTFVLPNESKPLKRGGLWLAQRAQCPIYPAFISGINCQLMIFVAIFLCRSRAKVHYYPQMYWSQEQEDKQTLEELQQLLEGRHI